MRGLDTGHNVGMTLVSWKVDWRLGCVAEGKVGDVHWTLREREYRKL